MSQDVDNEALACSTCRAEVRELRRGRCWTCYTQWAEQRPVGLGACCAVCEERRRDNLRLLEVQGRSLPLCHLCAAHVMKLEVVPYSIEGLRAALRRDRRQLERRDGQGGDGEGEPAAVQVERRAAQRRSEPWGPGAGIGLLQEDASLWQLAELDLDLDLGAEMDVDDQDIVEATVVAELPTQPRAAEVS